MADLNKEELKKSWSEQVQTLRGNMLHINFGDYNRSGRYFIGAIDSAGNGLIDAIMACNYLDMLSKSDLLAYTVKHLWGKLSVMRANNQLSDDDFELMDTALTKLDVISIDDRLLDYCTCSKTMVRK